MLGLSAATFTMLSFHVAPCKASWYEPLPVVLNVTKLAADTTRASTVSDVPAGMIQPVVFKVGVADAVVPVMVTRANATDGLSLPKRSNTIEELDWINAPDWVNERVFKVASYPVAALNVKFPTVAPTEREVGEVNVAPLVTPQLVR